MTPDAAAEAVHPSEVASLVADVRTWLEVHQAGGAHHPTGPAPRMPELPRVAAPSRPAPPRAQAPASRPPQPRFADAPTRDPAPRRPVAPAPANAPAPSQGAPAPGGALAAIREELGDCRRCGLCAGRKNIVFGVGAENADIVFVGEGPGFHEDKQGIPFVGAAGELLDKIIENVLRLDRSEVYIANVVKCRPPGNRNPEPAEVAACSPFLEAQLRAISPKVVVALGRFAIQTLLRSDESVGTLRGTAHPFGDGATLVPTYHPAYLLRNPADKRKTLADMMIVRGEYERMTGRPLPPVLRGKR